MLMWLLSGWIGGLLIWYFKRDINIYELTPPNKSDIFRIILSGAFGPIALIYGMLSIIFG